MTVLMPQTISKKNPNCQRSCCCSWSWSWPWLPLRLLLLLLIQVLSNLAEELLGVTLRRPHDGRVRSSLFPKKAKELGHAWPFELQLRAEFAIRYTRTQLLLGNYGNARVRLFCLFRSGVLEDHLVHRAPK